jgi:hypothetical protein
VIKEIERVVDKVGEKVEKQSDMVLQIEGQQALV